MIEATAKQPPLRYRHVDAIRGIAALSVVYFHAVRAATHAGWVTNGFEQSLFLVVNGIADLGK